MSRRAHLSAREDECSAEAAKPPGAALQRNGASLQPGGSARRQVGGRARPHLVRARAPKQGGQLAGGEEVGVLPGVRPAPAFGSPPCGPEAVAAQLSQDDAPAGPCLLYTSDAADEEDSVDLGGRRIIKK